MTRYTILIAALLLCTVGATAQSTIGRVLQDIESNNKTLQAQKHLTEAQKLDAKSGNYLSNPAVELNYLWGDKRTPGTQYELTAVQSFDFPTVYAHKNKLATLKGSGYDYQAAIARQQLLLTAKQTCLEIIYLRKQKTLLDERLKNAQSLQTLYQRRLEKGDANQLEINKIQLELLNAENESRLNTAKLEANMERLKNLNGGNSVVFDDNDYFLSTVLPSLSQLQESYLTTDPTVKNLQSNYSVAEQEIKLNKALSLPKFDLGYKRDSGPDDAFNGIVLGVSIPLFENKNTVKKARAQATYTSAVMDDNTLMVKSMLQQLYAQAQALNTSRARYTEILGSQRNSELLNKALSSGQISMIDYFIEITTLYDSKQNYLNVEKEYFTTLAEMNQYEL